MTTSATEEKKALRKRLFPRLSLAGWSPDLERLRATLLGEEKTNYPVTPSSMPATPRTSNTGSK